MLQLAALALAGAAHAAAPQPIAKVGWSGAMPKSFSPVSSRLQPSLLRLHCVAPVAVQVRALSAD